MKREKERVCSQACFKQSKISKIKAIGLDSKPNKNSLVYEERDIDGEIKLYKSTSAVDHLTFTIESGKGQWLFSYNFIFVILFFTKKISYFIQGKFQGHYLKHIDVPKEKGKGKDLAEFTLDVLKEFKSVASIKAIVLDNTNVNTGIFFPKHLSEI